MAFLKYLRAAKVALNEYAFPEKKVANIQSQLTKLVSRNYYLNKSARDAYRSYIMAYASHSLKDIFNVNKLDLKAVARRLWLRGAADDQHGLREEQREEHAGEHEEREGLRRQETEEG